jgi:redox-sensitive bicupin YhaK (pirin superfamily)
VEHLVDGRTRDLGDGFTVRRVLPAPARRMVGPFIFFDHMGPKAFAPGPAINVRPHPHIGLATVTYLYSGAIMHRDSLGYAQEIHPGDVNWMTAGRGIVHSERTTAEGLAHGVELHGIQSWVALPDGHEDDTPQFHHHPAATLPMLETADGARLRVIAGEAFGRRSPVATPWPTLYVDAFLPAGAAMELPAEHEERAVYVAEGALLVDDEPLATGQLAVLTPHRTVRLRAAVATRAMLLGGARFPEPRLISWNFVASSQARIDAAGADWQARDAARFPLVPGDAVEFIPLPG